MSYGTGPYLKPLTDEQIEFLRSLQDGDKAWSGPGCFGFPGHQVATVTRRRLAEWIRMEPSGRATGIRITDAGRKYLAVSK